VKDGIARVLFTVEAQEAILLHGFIKKSRGFLRTIFKRR